MDFGFPQGTSTEILKSYIYSEPINVEDTGALAAGLSALANFRIGEKKTVSAGAAQKSVVTGKSNRNELFVDVIENLSVVMDGSGAVLSRSIDGLIQMKSFLQGCPLLNVALNEDLIFQGNGYGSVNLLDYNFHESVQHAHFEKSRMVSLYPPEGECKLMGYRADTKAEPAVNVFAHFSDGDRLKHDLFVRVRCTLGDKQHTSDTVVTIPISSKITSVSTTLGDSMIPGTGHAQFDKTSNSVIWKAGNLVGGTEYLLRCTMILGNDCQVAINIEVPRILLTFVVPMSTASGLAISTLSFGDVGKNYNPSKWIRYLTKASSYVVRLA